MSQYHEQYQQHPSYIGNRKYFQYILYRPFGTGSALQYQIGFVKFVSRLYYENNTTNKGKYTETFQNRNS